MVYVPVDWDETTPINVANLDAMDAGIAGVGCSVIAVVELAVSNLSSVIFSDIPAGYSHLRVMYHVNKDGTGIRVLRLRLNGDTGNNYSATGIRIARDGTVAGDGEENTNRMRAAYVGTARSSGYIDIMGSGLASTFTNAVGQGGFRMGSSASDNVIFQTFSRWANTANVTSIALGIVEDNFQAGSTFVLYGWR